MRLFDLALPASATIILLVLIALVALLVKLKSKGPVLYWSNRVGRHNTLFSMPKFRSKRIGTPAVTTHLLTHPAAHFTPIGGFLRKSSLDELPQLWSILKGDMSVRRPTACAVQSRRFDSTQNPVRGRQTSARTNRLGANQWPRRIAYTRKRSGSMRNTCDEDRFGLTCGYCG